MSLNYQKKFKNGQLTSRGIEWTDVTWNPVAGCQHGCRWEMPDGKIAICYAETIAERVAAHAYTEGFDHHYWKPHHLNSPRKVEKPLKIFVGSMADLFGHWVKDWQIEEILNVARDCPQHTFQLLTKNPVRTTKFTMPSNVWVGSSSPPDFMWNRKLSQHQKERMLHRMMQSLANANATLKWMSFEPLSWDVTPIIKEYVGVLQWAVIGAASYGRDIYPPSTEDFLLLQEELDKQNVRVFFKGNMKAVPEASGENWREEYPDPVALVES